MKSKRAPARVARLLGLGVAVLSLGAESCGPPSPAQAQAAALTLVRQNIAEDLRALNAAARAMQAAAPAPDADGWNYTADRAAVDAMRAQWRIARGAYERIEGAIAILFSGLDVSTDARYDDFLSRAPDNNLFDGTGVTGMHGIERILYSNQIPDAVVSFERNLPGYQAARFPSTQQEASDFRNSLCQRLVTDTQSMLDQFNSIGGLDAPTAYWGVIGSMIEQQEKIDRASSGEEESRYAQLTMWDLRNNLDGARRTWEAFRPLAMVLNQQPLVQQIDQRFVEVRSYYDTNVPGDAIPPLPAGWNPSMPSAADLQSPYGRLSTYVHSQSDEATATSLVGLMRQGAMAMNIPEPR